MKTYKLSMEINAKAEDVIKLVTTPEWAEREAMADGALSAKARIEKSDAKSITIVIDREDPSRGPKGMKDSKNREKSVLTSTFDLNELRSRWSVKTIGKEKLVKVTGSTWIEPRGDKCRYCEKGEISIAIPLIGDIVAKSVVADIEKNFPSKKSLMEERLKQ